MSTASGWLGRLRHGLSRSSDALGQSLSGLLTRRRLDAGTISELEDALIAGDLGAATAAKLTQALARRRLDGDLTPDAVRAVLAADIAAILAPVARPLRIDTSKKPFVILVCGVNGGGKTTTIGKMAKQFRTDGHTVTLVAADTFRAAAVEQLQVWGARAGAPVIAAAAGADAAGLAFSALQQAGQDGTDVMMIDTAGRLQNRKDLMAELEKIVRVVKKLDPTAPHATLLVMDATIGQNTHVQVEAFKRMVDVSGLVVTKLDGSARGGVVVALAERFALPIHALGVGEGIDDLRPFQADAFARALMGL